jgi:hypothetical protein
MIRRILGMRVFWAQIKMAHDLNHEPFDSKPQESIETLINAALSD